MPFGAQLLDCRERFFRERRQPLRFSRGVFLLRRHEQINERLQVSDRHGLSRERCLDVEDVGVVARERAFEP